MYGRGSSICARHRTRLNCLYVISIKCNGEFSIKCNGEFSTILLYY